MNITAIMHLKNIRTGGAMSDININSQSLPARCEICHQSDFFDAANNYCSRCAANRPAITTPESAGKISIYVELKLSDFIRVNYAVIARRWFMGIWFAMFTVMPGYFLTNYYFD